MDSLVKPENDDRRGYWTLLDNNTRRQVTTKSTLHAFRLQSAIWNRLSMGTCFSSCLRRALSRRCYWFRI